MFKSSDPLVKSKSLPIEDIRAIVITAKGVLFSSDLINSLTINNCVILFCDNYKPSALITPLSKVVRSSIVHQQAQLTESQKNKLWYKVLKEKILGQYKILEGIGFEKSKNPLLTHILRDGSKLDESTSARIYFRILFKQIGHSNLRRVPKMSTPINSHLNYGYSVLSALLHRAIIYNGLIPQFGIKHVTRYQTHPLVYDLMEAFRPLVDRMLIDHLFRVDQISKELNEFEVWKQNIGKNLVSSQCTYKDCTIKLIDAIDLHVRSFARAVEKNSAKLIWYPNLQLFESERIAA